MEWCTVVMCCRRRSRDTNRVDFWGLESLRRRIRDSSGRAVGVYLVFLSILVRVLSYYAATI